MPLPKSIDAPYNFVPLADWIHYPEWSEQVSHDLPFRDGLSGHLDLDITTQTPLLVGDQQIPASANAPGQVRPFQLPDGRYAILGTSLKGMIRSVIEIASFSRMHLVDDIRYGLRDISGKYVKTAYAERIRNKINTGLMRRGEDGQAEIIPCSMVRLDHRDLESWLNIPKPAFRPERTVSKKYERWHALCKQKAKNPDSIAFTPVNDQRAQDLGQGKHQGIPVFTGQISPSEKERGKHQDFVFYDQRPQQRITLKPGEWADFLYVHGDQATKDSNTMSWPGYWKEKYWQGKAVPVFYTQDRDRYRIGLAYMPRLAGDFSTHQMIAHTCAEHIQDSQTPDFAQTLFGYVGDTPKQCLKGRVSFSIAVAATTPATKSHDPTILNGPKASYFPNYLQQDNVKSNGYATCLRTPKNPKPQIRGWKRYPVRPPEQAKVQALSTEQLDNKAVQVQLTTLAPNTRFHARVQFHNLKPAELGALCWALQWAGNDTLCHALGMGKSFGFGHVRIHIPTHHIVCNHHNDTPKPLGYYQDAFINHMESIAQTHQVKWRESVQIETLLGMADASKASIFEGKLQHMKLEVKGRNNEFLEAKQQALALAPYPTRPHPPLLWAEQEEKRLQALANEQADIERKRLQALANEQADIERKRQEAAFAKLSPAEQQIILSERKLQAYLQENEAERKRQRTEIIETFNKLIATCTTAEAHIREQAAQLISKGYDEIGWGDPGKARDKRKKQEAKRREQIAHLREPKP